MNMKNYLKYGGLALSAALTFSLFIRLFGLGPYGLLMALFGLTLFEGGAAAWIRVLDESQYNQRSIAKFALWFCLLASVLSSGAELILSTNLWKAPFDVGFATLVVIVGSLAVNVMGIVAHGLSDPDTAEINKTLDRQAKATQEIWKLEDMVERQSLIKARATVKDRVERISNRLSNEIADDVERGLLAQTRGGDNSQLGRLPPPTRQPVQVIEQSSRESAPSSSGPPLHGPDITKMSVHESPNGSGRRVRNFPLEVESGPMRAE